MLFFMKSDANRKILTEIFAGLISKSQVNFMLLKANDTVIRNVHECRIKPKAE